MKMKEIFQDGYIENKKDFYTILNQVAAYSNRHYMMNYPPAKAGGFPPNISV